MKKYLLLPFLCLLFFETAHATPDASDWYKVDLIGSNKTSFFYYLTHQELHGSHYYSFTHYYLVSRNIKTGEVEKKIHLKTTKNVSEVHFEGDEGIFTRKYEHPFISDINPGSVIGKENVSALYPNPDAPREFRFDTKGMHYIKGRKRKTLISKAYLDRFMPGYEKWLDWEDGIRIVQVYGVRDYYYYLVQYGTGGDVDFYQAILPVSTKVIHSLGK